MVIIDMGLDCDGGYFLFDSNFSLDFGLIPPFTCR